MATPYYPSDYDQAHRLVYVLFLCTSLAFVYSRRSRDFYRSDSHPDHEQEPLSLSSTFRDLDLDGTHDGRRPPSPSGSRSIHESPESPHRRATRNVSEPGDATLRRRTGPRESIDSPRLQNFSPTSRGGRVSPTMSRDVGLHRHRPRTPAINEGRSTHGSPSPGYGRYAGDRWRTSSASPASRVPHHFSREYHFYRSEDPYIDIRQTAYSYDRPVLCNCRTCVAHRYPMRNWTLPDYDDYGARESMRPVYPREVYPMARSTYARSSPRMPYVSSRRDDWVYPGEDYRFDTPDHDRDPLYGHYDYPSEEYTYPNLDRREMYGDFSSFGQGHGYGGSGYWQDHDSDDSYNGVGSGHEYSDGASYGGYRRYDGYSDGEYSGGNYSD